MIYFILLFLGLSIGAVFLAVLLVGDKKEARLEAQKKAQQEQLRLAGRLVEGAWPPPPSKSALPDLSPPVRTTKSVVTHAANRKMVRTFFLVRNYVIGTVILAYIIYSCFPRFNFGWVLFATAASAVLLWSVMMFATKMRVR